MLDYKQKAKEIYNSIRFIDGENPNCTTCDCVVKAIAIFHVKGIIEALPSSSKKTFKGDSKVSIYDYWKQVLTETYKD